MSRIRKFAAGIAVLWAVAIVAIGIGGSWLTRNPDALAEGTLAVAGIDARKAEAQRRAASVQRRQEKIEATEFKGDGWGEDAVSDQANGSDWAD
ncbi:MAG: hypothetical protein KDE32_07885 [Novosphingobium sp.]|nr:hypothetical protein [Novosphingobium sp.]